MAINKRLIKSNEGGAAVPTSFNTVLYTGNSGTQAITGVGFQPDLVWTKGRTVAYDHGIQDSVRGVNSLLYPSLAQQETITSDATQSFDSDGFTYGSNNKGNASNSTYVAWCWKAGGSAVAAGGTNVTNRLVSANPEAGISIMTYSGVNVDGTIEHGLNQAPEIVFFKNRTTNGKHWYTITTAIDGSVDSGFLNLTNAFGNALQTITNTTIALSQDGGTGWLNQSGSNYVCYAFHSVAGFSKIGSYTGNGSTTGPTITTDFEPAFVMIKRTTSTGQWQMLDNKRSPSNPRRAFLLANAVQTEVSSSLSDVDFNSNGFQIKTSWDEYNQSGNNYIYMAFANQF
jgi:hypothetical protein